MPTSRPRNNDGYSLVDAAVSLFVASVALIAILGALSGVVRFSGKTIGGIDAVLRERNDRAEAVLSVEK
jgi:hypothetical protein